MLVVVVVMVVMVVVVIQSATCAVFLCDTIYDLC